MSGQGQVLQDQHHLPYRPGAAEILRASQKDAIYIQGLQADILEWILLVKGQRTWLKFRNWAESIASFLYYTLTTLSGSQTLGEEYTGIVPVKVVQENGHSDTTDRVQVPSKKVLLGMILFQVFGERLLNEGKKILIKKANESNCQSPISTEANAPKTQNQTLKFGYWLNLLIPLASQFHQTLFFLQGKYYHLAKRILGVQYILLRKWYENPVSLKYLVWLSFINFGLSGLSHFVTYLQLQEDQEQESELSNNRETIDKNKDKDCSGDEDQTSESETESGENENRKCSLCLESRKSPSLTPCGHLFCWNCIMDWLRTSAICPICRETLLPNQVVPLQNYK